MPGLLEAFFVQVGWDATEYSRGRKQWEAEHETAKEKARKEVNEAEAVDRKGRETRERNQREVQDGQRHVRESLDETRRAAVETFAVLVGANSLKEYISNTVQIASNTERMAKAAGVGVQDLSAFGDAIARNGGNAETAKASIAGLAQAMYAARTLGIVSPEMNAAFGQIGANYTDDPMEVFAKFAGWAEGKDPRMVAQTGAMLGLDEASINEAMKGRRAVEANIQESRRLGAMNDEQAEKLKKLQAEWRHLTDSIKGNALSLLVDATPALSGFIRVVDDAVQKYPDLVKWIMAGSVALTTLGGAKLLGFGRMALGAGGTGGTAAAAGTAAATGAGWLAAAWASAVAVFAYAVHPTVANEGEDEKMRQINARWAARRVADIAGRRAKIIAYFMSQGWSEEEARGIAAGIEAENGKLHEGEENPISAGKTKAYGLGQWVGDRQRKFESVMDRPLHGSSFEQQLAFIQWELTNSEAHNGNRIRGKNASGAATAYLTHFMRPGAGLAGDLRRAGTALKAQTVTINGGVTITTNATDGKAVADAFRSHLARTGTAAMAQSGLQ